VRLGRSFAVRAPKLLVLALLLPVAVFAASLFLASRIAPIARPLPTPLEGQVFVRRFAF
jgi:hypothetical protein